MKKILLAIVAVLSYLPTTFADSPWYTRPQDWGSNGVILVPPRDPPHHNPIVEAPSGPSQPGIQFDQKVQTRPNIHNIDGNRYLHRDGQWHHLAPKQTGPSTSTVRNGDALGRTASSSPTLQSIRPSGQSISNIQPRGGSPIRSGRR